MQENGTSHSGSPQPGSPARGEVPLRHIFSTGAGKEDSSPNQTNAVTHPTEETRKPVSRRSLEALQPKSAVRWESEDAAAAEALEKEDQEQLGQTDLMDPIPPEKQLSVQINNVSAWVLPFAGPPSLAKQLTSLPMALVRKKVEVDISAMKQILYNVTGTCEPGAVLALMGPSGSGKTTMLSIMGNRAPKGMRVSGEVLFNGQPIAKRSKRLIGYVLQDDLLYEALTVYETLYYAAMLRLPRQMSREQKIERVRKVITALGINKCQDTIIGGFLRRGISGGERKRVSVGHELLINPSVLLLDEPTSGLDSTTAMALVRTLRQLSLGGRSIVTTLHQPASRLYQQLGKLMLLSEGHLMYYGKATLVADWFNHLGYTMPYGINMADFILDCASSIVTLPGRTGEESLQHMIRSAEKYLQHHPGGYFDPDDSSVERYAVNNNQSFHTAMQQEESEPLQSVELQADGDIETGTAKRDSAGLLEGTSRWGAPFWQQISILFERSLKTRRNETFAIQDISQYLIVAVLSGLFWLQRANSDQLVDGRDISGLLFFELVFVSLGAMFVAIFTFPTEYRMMVKERSSGMYRLSAFYLARTFSDLPMTCFLPTVLIIIVYFMGGLHYSAGAFFANWSTCILCLLVGQSLGLLIGATVTHPKTAQSVATVVILAAMLTAGFFITNIPKFIRWMKYLSFVYYGYSLLAKTEFDARFYNSPGNSATSLEVQQALGLPRDPSEWPWEALALIAWLLSFRYAVYVALRIKTRS